MTEYQIELYQGINDIPTHRWVKQFDSLKEAQVFADSKMGLVGSTFGYVIFCNHRGVVEKHMRYRGGPPRSKS